MNEQNPGAAPRAVANPAKVDVAGHIRSKSVGVIRQLLTDGRSKAVIVEKITRSIQPRGPQIFVANPTGALKSSVVPIPGTTVGASQEAPKSLQMDPRGAGPMIVNAANTTLVTEAALAACRTRGASDR